jgi:hypothetical protein
LFLAARRHFVLSPPFLDNHIPYVAASIQEHGRWPTGEVDPTRLLFGNGSSIEAVTETDSCANGIDVFQHCIGRLEIPVIRVE